MLQSNPNWEELYRKTIYAVSHDLGAPCRHIRSFSEIVMENSKGLDGDSKAMLGHIHQAGIEVQSMLEGLLRLSRVYSRTSRLSVITGASVSQHFDAISDGLRSDTDILGNLDQLEIAVEELIDNSNLYGKFSAVKVETKPKLFCLTVLDDGEGISTKDWENAREPLQRIGQRRTADNVGMGLPIAEAIVQQMNGSLVNRPEGVGIDIPAL